MGKVIPRILNVQYKVLGYTHGFLCLAILSHRLKSMSGPLTLSDSDMYLNLILLITVSKSGALVGAQESRGFEPHRRLCVMSLSKTH